MEDNERLQHFEDILKEIEEESLSLEIQVEEMKAKGKTKTATFKQLLARKMTLKQFLGIFEQHGLR